MKKPCLSTHRLAGPWYILAAALFLSLNPVARTAESFSVTVAWDSNAAQEQVTGYKVYLGSSPRNYDLRTNDVGNATQFTITGLAGDRAYTLAVTAYNFAGLESDFSEEVTLEPLLINTAYPNIVLSWPEIASTGFVLEENSSLSLPNNWSVTSQNAVTNGGVIRVTVNVVSGNKFFRLRHP